MASGTTSMRARGRACDYRMRNCSFRIRDVQTLKTEYALHQLFVEAASTAAGQPTTLRASHPCANKPRRRRLSMHAQLFLRRRIPRTQPGVARSAGLNQNRSSCAPVRGCESRRKCSAYIRSLVAVQVVRHGGGTGYLSRRFVADVSVARSLNFAAVSRE